MTNLADPIQLEGTRLMTLPRAVSPDENDTDYDGYYCVQTAPYLCNCRRQPWTFTHYSKKIIVWEENDDDMILKVATEFKKMGLDPKIVEFKTIYGKCITWADIPSNGEVE